MFMTILRLTPAGRGAVASFLLYGKNAENTFLPHWQGKTPDDQPRWGRLKLTDTGDCEEAVVLRTSDGIEIHTHGGEQIAAAIEARFSRTNLQSSDCRTECINPCFYECNSANIRRALQLLPYAPTERTAQILLDQYNGAFDREMSAIEQLPHNEKRQRRLVRLQELAHLGKHLVEPFRVVLAGASNAGKSSLLNAILGFQRSLVHSLPGTTRDVVVGQTALAGFPVTFFDTAGFRESDDVLEQQGIDRSLCAIADADLVIWVVDMTVKEPPSPVCPTETNVLICYNKMDLAGVTVHDSTICVSALTGEGIDFLLDAVIHRLVPHPPEPGEAVPC